MAHGIWIMTQTRPTPVKSAPHGMPRFGPQKYTWLFPPVQTVGTAAPLLRETSISPLQSFVGRNESWQLSKALLLTVLLTQSSIF